MWCVATGTKKTSTLKTAIIIRGWLPSTYIKPNNNEQETLKTPKTNTENLVEFQVRERDLIKLYQHATSTSYTTLYTSDFFSISHFSDRMSYFKINRLLH